MFTEFLHFILHLLSFVLLIAAMFGFYLLSNKQRCVTQNSRWRWILQQPKRNQRICIGFCVLSALCLMWVYGVTVGFVSWWIFATPLLFILIFKLNQVPKHIKEQGKINLD